MSKTKVIILTILTGLGVLLSMVLLSKTFGLEIKPVNDVCTIGENFNCERIANTGWARIFGVPQSMLITPIYLGLLIFFIAGLFVKGDISRERLLIIPFVTSIFLLVYSAFLFLNMVVLTPSNPKILGPFNLALYLVNLLIFIVMIPIYLKSLTERLSEVIKIPFLKNLFLILPIAIILFSIIFGVVLSYIGFYRPITLTERDKIEISSKLSAEPYDITTEGAPRRGENKKGLEIVVFEDFQCPVCRQDSSEIAKLMKYYGNKISLVFKHYPLESECHPEEIHDLHEYACEASYASMAADKQGKFWEYYDLLFSASLDGVDVIDTYAKKLNLDMDKFKTDMESKNVVNYVKKDSSEAYYSHRITGTPTLFFNGRIYRGPRNFEKLREVAEFVIKYPDYKPPKGSEYENMNEGKRLGEPEEVDIKDQISDEVYEINTEDSPIMGDNKIGMEIVVFEDFQCPACRRTSPELKKLMEHYDNGISLILKHYPLEKECFPIEIQDLHEYACEASYASISAQKQGKFKEYYDKLFSGKLTGLDLLTKYAEEVGLDMDKFEKDRNSEDVKSVVKADTEEGYNTFKITSTPTLFFNGRLYTGPKGYEEFVEVVEYILNGKSDE